MIQRKTVAVPLSSVVNGYGGARKIREAGPGLWFIVRASPIDIDGEKPAADGYRYVEVAQDVRGEKR